MSEIQELYQRVFGDMPSGDMTVSEMMDCILFAVESAQESEKIAKEDVLWLGFKSEGVLNAAIYDMELRDRVRDAITAVLTPVFCPSCDGIGKDETGEDACPICSGYGIRHENSGDIIWNVAVENTNT